jgi:hypothetical protein
MSAVDVYECTGKNSCYTKHAFWQASVVKFVYGTWINQQPIWTGTNLQKTNLEQLSKDEKHKHICILFLPTTEHVIRSLSALVQTVILHGITYVGYFL